MRPYSRERANLLFPLPLPPDPFPFLPYSIGRRWRGFGAVFRGLFFVLFRPRPRRPRLLLLRFFAFGVGFFRLAFAGFRFLLF